ncbi:biotin carboxylase N-terminal domain-containing protein [Salinicola sp. JS01]|uniref:acetyl/propionyl/methylcrotonyl-CoA carboxylase subunit alpha n=1 Tax=Salinicola sp. JS01 TaxID=3050071 RepID=UPI00255BEED3|nr:biotin carboxylase N-terminal domain-containing protein [Salinicola sp. JS01]WIX32770.1 biotin carboxylase N-terminal domain-containing protein [Salinicola sp. JS01]
MSLATAPRPLRAVLIANRGEIACRVIRTARRLGLRTIAVYSDADARARHVREADEAIRLGPAAAGESYLAIDKVIAAAQRSGADAIHPGYGFLSENAEFVAACDAAGLVFIGPPASAMAAMGDKAAAKARMASAGVPLVPGYRGEAQDDALLREEAGKIGFPVLLKASAGGGGKGMRVVESEREFQAALDGCRRESRAAFGDERMLIEKYLTQPRHVEVQVFCDSLGAGVYLFERDCSVQRRHQKVLEEAPAPHLPEALRREMGEAAVRAAQEIGYVGAGTVEFLLDAAAETTQESGSPFYFMEMNTRLQVEHPVTEMISGEDLVEWQLRVAAGLALPKAQSELTLTGHAIEARLYAEDPDNDFLPATGKLLRFALPLASADLNGRIRLDSGVEAGDTVTMHYDPMLAKLIVHGEDRGQALAEMARALAALDISGVTTNRRFLQRLVTHPDFIAAELNTRFIEHHHDALFAAPHATDADIARAALVAIDQLARNHTDGTSRADDPWQRRDGWRLNAPHRVRLAFQETDGSGTYEVIATQALTQGLAQEPAQATWQLQVQRDGEETSRLAGQCQRLDNDTLALTLDGHRQRLFARLDPASEGDAIVLTAAGQESRLIWRRADRADHLPQETEAKLTAPMHGTVVALLAEPGQTVEKGTPLVVVEAMKMEHTLSAPADGAVEAFHVAVGDAVAQGDELLAFTNAEAMTNTGADTGGDS